MNDADWDNLDQQEIFQLAQSRPDLWGSLLGHPSMYPDLAQWIVGQMPPPEMPPVPLPPEQRGEALGAQELRAQEPRAAEPRAQEPGVAEAGIAVKDVPARSGNRWLIPAIAAALALVALIGGGLFWFLRGHEPAASALDTIPKKAVLVALEPLGANATFMPIGPDGELYVTDGKLRKVLINQGDYQMLVTVDTQADTTEPMRVENVDGPCWQDGAAFGCGSVVEADFAEQSGAMPMAQSHLLSGTASDDAPYYVEDGVLYFSKGTAVSTENGSALGSAFTGPTWALPGKGKQWIVGGGDTVAALDGAEVLWSRTLTEEDTELNGFRGDQPSWSSSAGVALYARGGELNAQRISTGEILWRVEVPLTSYVVAEEMILVSMGDALALIPLTGEDATTGGDPNQKSVVASEDTGEGEQADEATVSIDPEALQDATLEVSEECARRVIGDEVASTFTFSNGKVEGLGPTGEAYVEIVDVSVVSNDGSPYALATLMCEQPAGASSMEVAVYDANLARVQSLYPWTSVTADVSRLTEMTSLDASDNRLTIVSGPWLGFGDDYCLTCEGSYFANVDYAWSGGEYVVSQVSYDSPNGVVAMPDMDLLNEIYTQVSKGSEAKVTKYFTGSAAEDLLTLDTSGIGPRTILWYSREIYFASGGMVDGCSLVPPVDTPTYFAGPDITVDGIASPYGDIQPGDIACLVFSPSEITPDRSGPHIWWMIRPSSDPKDFQIYMLGRDFS